MRGSEAPCCRRHCYSSMLLCVLMILASVDVIAEKVKDGSTSVRYLRHMAMPREKNAVPYTFETEEAAGCYRTSWWQRD